MILSDSDWADHEYSVADDDAACNTQSLSSVVLLIQNYMSSGYLVTGEEAHTTALFGSVSKGLSTAALLPEW